MDELILLFEVVQERVKRQVEISMGAFGGLTGSSHRSSPNDITINNPNDTKQLPFGVGHTTIEKGRE